MRPRLALLIVLLLAPFAAPAMAQPAQPLDRLLPEVRRNLPGQFLDAEPGPNDGGSPSYRLKWLTPDGRVIWRDVDARNGRVMRQPPDRGFNRREDAPPPPRGNFREDENGGGFGNRGFAPRPQYEDQRQRDYGANRPPSGDGGFGNRRPQFGDQGQRGYGQDRFNRPSSGAGGFGNRGDRFGGRGFGGGNGGGRFGGGGGGRARGRGGND